MFAYTSAVLKACRILLALLLASAGVSANETVTQRYLGYVSCQSSSCHGGSERGEVMIWKEEDFHSRAFPILATSRSARMAETLHIADATKSARCTVCHSPFQALPPEVLAKTAHPDEGVSCESCHGAAEPWIRAHTRRDFNYQNRIAVGMRDLRSIYGHANNCVACHENIEPAILEAGHPELIFELASQTMSEPPHWREEGEWLGAREWLTGQAVALREVSWQLTKANEARALSRWKALVWLMSEVTSQVDELQSVRVATTIQAKQDFSIVQQTANRIAQEAEKMKWSADKNKALLEKLSKLDSDFTPPGDVNDLARRAEVLVQALDRLAVSFPLKDRPKNEAFRALDRLFEDVRHPQDFEPAQFAKHLREFQEKLTEK